MTLHPRALTALCALAAAALLACGTGVEDPSSNASAAEPTRGTSALENAFDDAAHEYQVPGALLRAIAHVETRSVSPGASSPSNVGGYGVMNLADREDWNALTQAAQLTGDDKGRILLDDRANIRAAAAFLRQLADRTFEGAPDLNPHDTADWWPAVSLYPGFDSHTQAQEYAAEIFRTLDRGFADTRQDGTVIQPAVHYDWQRHAPVAQRQDALKEYPGAYQWIASPNYTSGRSSYSNVIIHTMQGSYSGSISWFQNSSSNVSAHYCVRSSDGQITQMVMHANTAWHAQCYNSRSIGIEHEGYAQNPSAWYTNAMYTESGKLTRWICDRHNIPKDRSHIIGHAEVPSSCNTGGHWDPGTGWNWTKYMGIVLGSTPSTGTGALKGVIYTGGSTTNRVQGATVSVNGQTQTTPSDGSYSFNLAPGTYTVNVSKSGYTSNSVSRTVTAGATIWGSMEINPVSQNGTLTGIIYTGGSSSNRVSGAVVTVGSQSVTTASDGLYEFTLAPGTYNVSVTKSGYSTNTVTRTVTASSTVWGSMEINTVASSGTLKGILYTGGDTANRVSGATVSVGGTSQSLVTGADGVYSFDLPAGTYTVTASKSGFQNASVTRTVSSGATVWGSMELVSGTQNTSDTVPPNVAITFPGDGAAMELAILTLTGTATDDKGTIDSVTLKINDGTPAKLNVTSGAFSQQIKLSPGLNHLEVSATDAAGNTSVDTVEATFRAGVSGFIHVVEDEAARLPDVSVRLLDPATGNEVAATTSAADGSFGIDLTDVGRDYVLVAKVAGYVTHTETLTVPDDERLNLKLPMAAGSDPVPDEVKVEFVDPKDGATVETEQVTIYGTVGGFQVAGVVVNGVQAELVGAGGFAATVPLTVGANTIEAVATGVGGETLTGSMTLNRKEPAAQNGDGSADSVKGGCTAIPGLELLALFAVVPLLRRRRT